MSVPPSGENGVLRDNIQESYLFCGKIVVRNQVKVFHYCVLKFFFSFYWFDSMEKPGL